MSFDVAARLAEGRTAVTNTQVYVDACRAVGYQNADLTARGGQVDARRVGQALDDLRNLPLQRVEHTPFLGRCWELRENVTIYDAAYVALAEALQAPLLTGDRRLARASGPRCSIEVMKTQP